MLYLTLLEWSIYIYKKAKLKYIDNTINIIDKWRGENKMNNNIDIAIEYINFITLLIS